MVMVARVVFDILEEEKSTGAFFLTDQVRRLVIVLDQLQHGPHLG